MPGSFNRRSSGRAVDDTVRKSIPIVSISPFQEDHVFLRDTLKLSGCRVDGAGCRSEAFSLLRKNRAAVVICEKDLPDGTWQEVLDELAQWENAPPLIVTSRLADDSLWAEVLNLGGYDVLMKPLDPTEVSRVVNLAWEHSQRGQC
jgi:DNA-binding response OmpR family regulator